MKPIAEHEVSSQVIKRILIVQACILLLAVIHVIVFSIMTDQLGSFQFSFFAGSLGSSIALLRRIPSQPDIVLERILQSWSSTLMPMIVGGFMATVTYLIFMSGILTGDGGGGLFTSNLFPNFTEPTVKEDELLSLPVVLEIRPAKVIDAGKLMVWSFIAGYSEKFIPQILASLERRGTPGAGSQH